MNNATITPSAEKRIKKWVADDPALVENLNTVVVEAANHINETGDPLVVSYISLGRSRVYVVTRGGAGDLVQAIMLKSELPDDARNHIANTPAVDSIILDTTTGQN